MSNADQDRKRSINEGYQPDKKGYQPNGSNNAQSGHIPATSEIKPTNLPKKR